MADDPDTRSRVNDHKAREQARLARALRENLRRRKAQARGRAIAEDDQGPETHDSAGIGDDKQTG
jgi:tRNA A37 threonylcarbamoyladenosine dehydratase